ncbi:nuclear transport factor 2 family protein [Nocardia mexicana]|uniref:SnoaL-like protein n=1 Tax=Nocardia mexicana TaxID=279262 RepID=A0A370H2B8_9NOCA|nr:nuclear transport factor 2 family protein [Nocardia mexicana]RDI49977.1 SnoaL-like protein [Nocardia mexicana]
MTETLSLEQRVALLEDRAAIEALTTRYAHAVNHGYGAKTLDIAAIGELFAPDARWHSDGIGTTVGADAIAAALPAATAHVEFAMHAFLNPTITLDGDTATGSWLFWIASVIAADPRAVYMSADLTYTRTSHGWRIQTIDIHPGIRLPAPTR